MLPNRDGLMGDISAAAWIIVRRGQDVNSAATVDFLDTAILFGGTGHNLKQRQN